MTNNSFIMIKKVNNMKLKQIKEKPIFIAQ